MKNVRSSFYGCSSAATIRERAMRNEENAFFTTNNPNSDRSIITRIPYHPTKTPNHATYLVQEGHADGDARVEAEDLECKRAAN